MIEKFGDDRCDVVNGMVVCQINLSNTSCTLEAAKITTQIIAGNDSFANVTNANLSDIIASQMVDEGLTTLKEICDEITATCPLIEYIDLSDNALGSTGVKACESFFRKCMYLHSLKLCNNGLSAEAMDQVVELPVEEREGLTDNATGTSIAWQLQSIHFSRNMSEEGGCTAFVKLLHHCDLAKLKDICFSRTSADRAGTFKVVQALCEIMLSGQKWDIQRLNLAEHAFYEEGGAMLASILEKCPCLTCLNVRDSCPEDPNTLISICEALVQSDCPLQYLDVSGNELTHEGCKKGCTLLLGAKATTLLTLHAEDNELEAEGIAYLAEVIGGSSSRSVLHGEQPMQYSWCRSMDRTQHQEQMLIVSLQT
jgi:hypothetical protein